MHASVVSLWLLRENSTNDKSSNFSSWNVTLEIQGKSKETVTRKLKWSLYKSTSTRSSHHHSELEKIYLHVLLEQHKDLFLSCPLIGFCHGYSSNVHVHVYKIQHNCNNYLIFLINFVLISLLM